MRICNVMLGKGLGGIEQSFLDYTESLLARGHFMGVVTHPQAAVNPALDGMNVSQTTLSNRGVWDGAAPGKLRAFIRTLRADIVIAHGNRAVVFASKAVRGEVPVVAVAHNYQFQYLHLADVVFALTHHMAAAIHEQTGFPLERICIMPNMIRMESGGFVRRTWGDVPTIGAMGRFVPKKGFDVFLRALALLKENGYPFRARIGGSGPCAGKLKRLTRRLGLAERVEFTGWVHDKQAFFDGIDLFCLPSHHEPFGIVLLEAFAQKLPVVATDTEGPSEMIVHGETGLIVPRADVEALAAALAALLEDESRARDLAGEGWRSAKLHFEMGHLAQYMSGLLENIVASYASIPSADEAASRMTAS